MHIVVLCAVYAVGIICYRLGLRILFDTEVPITKSMAIGIVLPVVIGMLPIRVSGKNFFVIAVVALIIFISLKEKLLEKAVKIAFTMLFLACLEDVFIDIERTYYKGRFQNFICGESIELLMSVIYTTILLVIAEKVFVSNQRKTETRISAKIYLLLGITIMSMLDCLATLNIAKAYIQNKKFIAACEILNIVISISICLLVVLIIYIKNTQERMSRLLETEKLLKEAQADYYRQLLKKEEDTKKYRHDMNNHLMYVQTLLYENKIDEAKKYIDDMQGIFQTINKTYYVTGNEMVDAIMNYFFGRLGENVTVEIIGKCPSELAMEEVDICTVFSNIFQNIIEELNQNPTENQWIKIFIRKGSRYIEYTIKNSIQNKSFENDTRGKDTFIMKKENHRHYGIGLVNIRTTVEKYKGEFSWNKTEEEFCIKVILPLKEAVYEEK